MSCLASRQMQLKGNTSWQTKYESLLWLANTPPKTNIDTHNPHTGPYLKNKNQFQDSKTIIFQGPFVPGCTTTNHFLGFPLFPWNKKLTSSLKNLTLQQQMSKSNLDNRLLAVFLPRWLRRWVSLFHKWDMFWVIPIPLPATVTNEGV